MLPTPGILPPGAGLEWVRLTQIKHAGARGELLREGGHLAALVRRALPSVERRPEPVAVHLSDQAMRGQVTQLHPLSI